MSDMSSTDTIALRREARRRRILENSENRLKSITGKVSDAPEEDNPKTNCCYMYDFRSDRSHEMFRATSQTSTYEGNSIGELQTVGSIFNDRIDEEIQGQKTVETNSSFNSIIQKRFHYVILSVIVQFLYFSKLGSCFYNNVFCPFITLKIMELMLMNDPSRLQQQSFLTLLASMSKGPIIIYTWKAFSTISILLSDFFLYIFVIVATDKLLNFIKDF